jgi:hypothetical protein
MVKFASPRRLFFAAKNRETLLGDPDGYALGVVIACLGRSGTAAYPVAAEVQKVADAARAEGCTACARALHDVALRIVQSVELTAGGRPC